MTRNLDCEAIVVENLAVKLRKMVSCTDFQSSVLYNREGSLSAACTGSWFAFDLSLLHQVTQCNDHLTNTRDFSIEMKKSETVPVADVGKYRSLHLMDYDFQHLCSNHSKPTFQNAQVKDELEDDERKSKQAMKYLWYKKDDERRG